MNKSSVIFKTTKSYTTYILLICFSIASLCAIYMGADYIIIGALLFFTLVIILNDELSIVVYNDHFVLRYSNVLGNLMAFEDAYYYKDIRKIEVSVTEKWKANLPQTILAIIVDIFLPGRNGRLTEGSKTTVTIETLNDFAEIITKKIHFGKPNKNMLEAIEIIKNKCSSK